MVPIFIAAFALSVVLLFRFVSRPLWRGMGVLALLVIALVFSFPLHSKGPIGTRTPTNQGATR